MQQFYDSRKETCIYEQKFLLGLKFTSNKMENKTFLVFISCNLISSDFKKDEISEIYYYMKRMLLKFKR